MKLNDIKTTGKRIEQGAWVRNLPNLPGVAVKVRGYGNSDYKRVMAEYRGKLTPEEASDPATQDKIQTRLLHETILEDWTGIEDAKYSPNLAKTLLEDPDMGVFRSAVEYAAGIVAQDGHESLEADAKN
jgi:hypothetical protein